MPLVRSCGMKAVEEQRRFARRVLPSTLQGGGREIHTGPRLHHFRG